jgi:hypothetical protein
MRSKSRHDYSKQQLLRLRSLHDLTEYRQNVPTPNETSSRVERAFNAIVPPPPSGLEEFSGINSSLSGHVGADIMDKLEVLQMQVAALEWNMAHSSDWGSFQSSSVQFAEGWNVHQEGWNASAAWESLHQEFQVPIPLEQSLRAEAQAFEPARTRPADSARVLSSFVFLPSVGTWLILPSPNTSNEYGLGAMIEQGRDSAASVGAESQASVEEAELGDCFGEGCMPEGGDELETAVTWRMLPASMQTTPDDIGELAYKDLHCQIVCRVAKRLWQRTSDPKVVVVAALASQILFESWGRRQLGKIPRTSQSMGDVVKLLADDVERAVKKLSDAALLSLTTHIKDSH